MTRPSVSIVIPTYNQRPSYLQSALESAFAQTVPVEVVLVDDGSDEPVDPWPLARKWIGRSNAELHVVRHESNIGIAAALNSGIRVMTGDWFCWLPSDDLFAPNKVEKQLASTLASGRVASYHRYYATTREDGTPESVSYEHRADESHKHQRQRLASGCVINGLTVMIHRSVFQDVGPFDESFELAQDWELWCRIAKKHAWHFMPDVLATRRTTGNLTERTEQEPELGELLRSENARVKQMYQAWWS